MKYKSEFVTWVSLFTISSFFHKLGFLGSQLTKSAINKVMSYDFSL